MFNAQKFENIVLSRAKLSYSNYPQAVDVSNKELEDIFGNDYIENSFNCEKKGVRGSHHTIYFEHNNKMSYVEFTFYHDINRTILIITIGDDEKIIYNEVTDKELIELKKRKEEALKELDNIEKVLKHPKNRLRELFL